MLTCFISPFCKSFINGYNQWASNFDSPPPIKADFFLNNGMLLMLKTEVYLSRYVSIQESYKIQIYVIECSVILEDKVFSGL